MFTFISLYVLKTWGIDGDYRRWVLTTEMTTTFAHLQIDHSACVKPTTQLKATSDLAFHDFSHTIPSC